MSGDNAAMDNATYDALNHSQGNSNVTYSTLATISTRINNNHETKRNEEVHKQGYSNGAPSKILLMVIIIMMVILLIIAIASLALSVAAYNQPRAEQSTVQSQQSEPDSDATATQTLPTATCNNISQILLQVDTKINDLRSLIQQNTDMEPQSNCGPGLWQQVTHLNMSDPSQQCPSVWREYNIDGVRACGRPITSTGSCATRYYSTSQLLLHLIQACNIAPNVITFCSTCDVNTVKIYLFTMKLGKSIWTCNLIANKPSTYSAVLMAALKCPCSTTNSPDPPSSIGDNYYCESGNPDNSFMNKLYSDDPLWDGKECEGTCCTGINSPPWFSVQLPAPTTDLIEVSIFVLMKPQIMKILQLNCLRFMYSSVVANETLSYNICKHVCSCINFHINYKSMIE